MSGWAWPASAFALSACCLFLSIAQYSLRDFSRSRLEEICRERRRENRFSAILKHYEVTLLGVDLLQIVGLMALAAMVFEWRQQRLSTPSELRTSAILLESALYIAAVCVGLVVFPWVFARVAGESFLARFWPVLNALRTVLKPALSLARRIDTYAHRLTGLEEPDADEASSLTEEIRTVVDEGQREGVIESEARTMIHRVIELQEESVTAIMTPRTEMTTIPVQATLDDARREFLQCGHSRIPVIGATVDDIVGVLYAKDLLRHLHDDQAAALNLRDVVREPLYVPETTGIDSLLQTMKRDRVHFALVVDEYGGVSGLVTMEDILEEIVGEIGDEYDSAEEAGIVVLEHGLVEAAAWVRIVELNERFDLELPEDEDFDTVGGFVFSQLGRIPKVGDAFDFEHLGFTVLSADKRKIDKLQIRIREKETSTTDDAK